MKKKNILTATCSNVSFSTNNYRPTLVQSNKIGELLSIESGKVKIGKGIKRVLVSAGTFIDTANSNNYLWFFLNKNGSTVASSLVAGGMVYKSCSISPRLVSVVENDLIDLTYDNTGGFPATIRGGNETWLTVEVVEYI